MKKHYNKFSFIVRQRNHEIYKKREIIAKKTNRIYSFNQRDRSLFFDSNNRFENQIFIESTTISKTNSKRTTKRHIEQSFDDVSSADDLIDQSAKRNRKHLFAANNTISFVQNTRNQNFRFSSHWTTNRQLYKINWKNRFDQNLRNVKNDSLFA